MAQSVNLGTVHVSLEMRLSKMRDGIRDAKRELKGLEASLEHVAATSGRIGRNLSLALTAPILLLGKQSIDTAAKLDSLNMGIRAVDGEATDLKKTLKDLDAIAKLPGLGLVQAREGYVNLRAAGVAADFAKRSLMAFGNALATVGKGKAELDGVNYALVQLANRTSGFGQEIRQLQNFLPQIRQGMLAAFGTTDAETISKSGITGMQFVERLVEHFETLPKVTGGARNALENFDDSLIKLKESIGKTLLPSVIKWMEQLVPKIEAAVNWFNKLSPAAKDAFANMTLALAAGGPILVGLGAMINALTTINGLLLAMARNPVMLAALAGVGTYAFLEGGGGAAIDRGMGRFIDDLKASIGIRDKQITDPELAKVLGMKAPGAPGFVSPRGGNIHLKDFFPNLKKFDANLRKKATNVPLLRTLTPEEKARMEFGQQYGEDAPLEVLRQTPGRQFTTQLRSAEKEYRDAVAKGAKRADAEAVLAAKVKAIWQDFYDWRDGRERQSLDAALDFTLQGWRTKTAAGKKIGQIPTKGPQLPEFVSGILESFRDMEIPPVVTKQFAEKLAEDLPAELGKAIQEALDKAHDESIPKPFKPGTRDVVADNLIPLDEIAKAIKPKAAKFSFDLGRELGSNLAYELGAEFSSMFDRIFGTGSPLARALSRTLGRLVDDMMYAIAQQAIGNKFMISLLGGAGGMGGGGGVAGGIDPMTGNPVGFGAAGGMKVAGAKAGAVFGYFFAAAVATKLLEGLISVPWNDAMREVMGSRPDTGRFRPFSAQQLNPAMAGFSGMPSGMPMLPGGRSSGVTVNFHGANFNNDMDPKRAAESTAWHIRQKMASRPGYG